MLEAFVYSVPLTTRFRGITVRDGVLLRGPAGWAEVSPFWDYDAAESAHWLRAGLAAALGGFPTPIRRRIPVNVTVPAVDAEQAYRIAANSGCHTAKVKVAEPGQTLADDIARVEAVRAAFDAVAAASSLDGSPRPYAKIRIDVNGTWDLETALAAIPELDRAAGGLEYVEQPCASVADLARVRRAVSVPIAADESIRRAEDPFRVVQAEAADVVVLKVQPIGGVQATLDLAEKIGLPVVVSSALDSSVGIRMGLALAGALPELNYGCGLATARLLAQDVTSDPLLPDDGAITVRDVEPDNLAAVAADAQLQARWKRRLEQMWAHLDHPEVGFEDLNWGEMSD